MSQTPLHYQQLRLSILYKYQYNLSEIVFLDLEGTRYKWETIDNTKTKLSSSRIETTDFSIGIISQYSTILLKFLELKVLFLDLGNTLVTLNDTTGKYVAFPETDVILQNLKRKGVETGVISDGNRSTINSLLADPSFLDKFRVVVRSDDSEVGGARKPHARIFNVAISKMKKVLNTSLSLSETALLTETIEHFKAYNLLYSLDGRKIIREWFKEYFEL